MLLGNIGDTIIDVPITVSPLKVEDLLRLMALNAEVYPEFDKLPPEYKKYICSINLLYGIAQSYFVDGKIVAVAGIRYLGVGEAWMVVPPDVSNSRNVSLRKRLKTDFIRTRTEHNLCRIFTESRVSDPLLGDLGFRPQPDGYVWTEV